MYLNLILSLLTIIAHMTVWNSLTCVDTLCESELALLTHSDPYSRRELSTAHICIQLLRSSPQVV